MTVGPLGPTSPPLQSLVTGPTGHRCWETRPQGLTRDPPKESARAAAVECSAVAGTMVLYESRTSHREHPFDASSEQPRPDRHRLRRRPPGGRCGLLLPATLAQHLGLQELADSCVDLGDAPGRANAGDKLLTLIASALAGGECIDDAAALRAGGTASVLGICTVKAPSTLGTFLRSFSWGHVRQLDRVSRELLARAWAAGAGPGDAPFTIDSSTRRSVRPTAWRRRAPASPATRARAAITRCSPLGPGRVTC